MIPQKPLVCEGTLLDNFVVQTCAGTRGSSGDLPDAGELAYKLRRVSWVLAESAELHTLLLSFFPTHNETVDIDANTLDSLTHLVQAQLSSHISLSAAMLKVLSLRVAGEGTNLSAGQQMLVSLVRCLGVQSDWLVVDELSAALDSVTAVCVYSVLHQYCLRRPHCILLMICHKMQDVHLLCNKVCMCMVCVCLCVYVYEMSGYAHIHMCVCVCPS
ncbi:hypothetical protein EON63_25120 [archaeon]|nr:MAG: hypothetical protein EON63_25120 [archaeon]